MSAAFKDQSVNVISGTETIRKCCEAATNEDWVDLVQDFPSGLVEMT